MVEINHKINEIIKKLILFRNVRKWKKFHNPKNLAISISLEAAELLEHFQWKNLEESTKFAQENKKKISDEIADLLIYILYLCNDLDINFLEAINRKIEENNIKYPVDKFKGKSNKYNEI